MYLRQYAALLGVVVLSACATIRPSDTQPLLTSATALRANLHNEAAAVDAAYQTISDATDAVCAHPRIGQEFATWCQEWKPPASGAAPGAQRTEADVARKGLASAADAGMDRVLAYIRAVHAMAEAGERNVAAADSVNQRLGALSGLLGAADGPLSFVGGEAFGAALKALAQANTAYQVRRTLRAATTEAQFTLDLYALAMRNALAACDVVPPPALLSRVRDALPTRMAGVENRDALIADARRALDNVSPGNIGTSADPCSQSTYDEVVAREGDALLVAEQFRTSFSFMALQGLHDQMDAHANSLDDILADLDRAGAFRGGSRSAQQQEQIDSLLTRLRALTAAQAAIEPFRPQINTLTEREMAARRFTRDRREGATRLARAFFALAQEHRAFAEVVEERRGFDLSSLLGAKPASSAEPTEAN